jgi:hypothetical protein
MAARRSREEFLAARLADLVGHWLEIHCSGCEARVFYPGPLMANERGNELRVVAVLRRLRCRHCGSPAASVAMTNDPTGGAQGGDSTSWRVPLEPES